MKSGLLKRVLAIGMIGFLLAGDVMPVLAQSADGVVEDVVDESTEASVSSSTEEDTASDETANDTNSVNQEETNLEDTNQEEGSAAATDTQSSDTNTESAGAEQETSNEGSDEADENSSSEEEMVSENDIDETVSGNEIVAEAPVTMSLRTTDNTTITVTINHYLGSEADDEDMLFMSDEVDVEEDESISDFIKGEDYYSVSSIELNGEEVELEDGKLVINMIDDEESVEEPAEETTEESEDLTAVVNVFYEASEGTYENEVSMIDYVNGNSGDSKSINYFGNYDSDVDYSKRMATMGAYDNYRLVVEQSNGSETVKVNANAYYRSESGTLGGTENITRNKFPIITGLLQGLSGSNYENVNFTYADPGFFTSEVKAGKTILDGYSLGFDRTGMKYTLTTAYKDGSVVCNDLSNFFPVGSEYFGMRYDFSFKIGDYLGDMTYSFIGDDDLWVCMNGDVILDLGGIHGAYPGTEYNGGKEWDYAPASVDIWEVLLGTSDYTVEDKIEFLESGDNSTKDYTITVLFMERGGNKSNCHMTFVMPNIVAKDPIVSTSTPAELQIKKVDAEDNSAMENVIFTLTNSKGNTMTATTDAAGMVSFGTLREGTYTLAETVPAGYQEAGPWTVTVASTTVDNVTTHYVSGVVENGGAALAASGNVYTIKNEKIIPAISQEKEAELVDWDDRTYKITLSASSNLTNTETTSGAVDIVLSLDVSSSMNSASGNGSRITRIEALKSAVSSFIESVAESSPASRIGIVTFSGNSYKTVSKMTTLDEAGEKALLSAVNGISTNTGTPMQEGLNGAYNLLSENDNKDNANYVIFVSDFTEGMNTNLSSTKTAASNVRNIATLMTLGVLVDERTKDLMTEIASEDSNGAAYAYFVDDATEMTSILDGLSSTIVSAVPVVAEKIVDYIDDRFVVTDADGNELSEGAEIADANGNKGYLRKDNNGYYVEWKEVSIAHASTTEDGETAGWSAEIFVKAKDDFIGGNMIPTNGTNSGITLDGETTEFDKPTVNVKLLDLAVENKEITLFKGETITPAEYIADLAEGVNLVAIDEEAVPMADAPVLTNAQIGSLVEDKTLTVDYSYSDEEMGSFTYTLESEYDLEDHEAVKVGENVENYTLKVTYEADSINDRKENMDDFEEPNTKEGTESFDGKEVIGSNEVDNKVVSADGIYKVNVVAGSLVIKKTLDTTDIDFEQGDAIFTFKVMKDGKFHSYHTVRFTEGMDGEITVATLTDLEKGVYTVEECNTMRYELDYATAAGVGANAADAEVNSDKAIFYIGRTSENEDTDLDNRDGEAGFKNKKVNDRNFSDTDVVVNTFVIDEDGSISWTADSLTANE